jgi:hypothetical protein
MNARGTPFVPIGTSLSYIKRFPALKGWSIFEIQNRIPSIVSCFLGFLIGLTGAIAL